MNQFRGYGGASIKKKRKGEEPLGRELLTQKVPPARWRCRFVVLVYRQHCLTLSTYIELKISN
jgi:hypothetical protein